MKIRMKSGTVYEFGELTSMTKERLVKELNKSKFYFFGPMILNTSEIESIEIIDNETD